MKNPFIKSSTKINSNLRHDFDLPYINQKKKNCDLARGLGNFTRRLIGDHGTSPFFQKLKRTKSKKTKKIIFHSQIT